MLHCFVDVLGIMKTYDRVIFNVSGDIFETKKKTLQRYPETLLGNKMKMLKFYCNTTKLFFINRNRKAFEAILFFYQSDGDLRIPLDLKMDIFIQECHFYEIPKKYIDSMLLKAGVLAQTIQRDEKDKQLGQSVKKQQTTFRSRMWDFFENPETSSPARYFAIISFLHILASVLLSCLETVGELKQKKIAFWKNPFNIAELYLNTVFLVEFLLRLAFCPNFLKFMKTVLNLVDILAILPYFIMLAVGAHEDKSSATGVLRLLRFVRVLRLFRLSKHSSRIKEVVDILRSSLQDLYIFFLCLFIMTVFSGAILYSTESADPSTRFTSIPEGMWWAIQTVVTLGYGDIVPVTVIGKIYSAFFMVFGALTIALPVLSIVMKFTHMYSMDPTNDKQSTSASNKKNTGQNGLSIRSRDGSMRSRAGSIRAREGAFEPCIK